MMTLFILGKHNVYHSKNEQRNPGRYHCVQPQWTNVMFIRLMSHQNIIHTFFLIRFWMIELLLGEHKHIPQLPPFSNFVDVFLPGRGKVRPGNLSISQQELFKHKANVSISRWVLELTRWLAVTLVQQFTSLKNHSFFSALSHLIEFLMTVHIWAEILWSLPPWNSLSH